MTTKKLMTLEEIRMKLGTMSDQEFLIYYMDVVGVNKTDMIEEMTEAVYDSFKTEKEGVKYLNELLNSSPLDPKDSIYK